MSLHQESLKTGKVLAMTNTALVPAGAQIPTALLQKWDAMPPARFAPQKALQCLEITQGAWRDISPASVLDALRTPAPTIGAIKTYIGEAWAVQVVKEMIAAASLLLNVGKNLHEAQIGPAAQMICGQILHFTVSDFRAAMNMGCLGKFGSTFDRFDVQVIAQWCSAYWEMRLQEAEAQSEAARQREREKLKGVPPPPEVQAWLSKLYAKVDAKQHRTAADFTPDEALIAHWEKEWEAQGKPCELSVYIKIKTSKIK